MSFCTESYDLGACAAYLEQERRPGFLPRLIRLHVFTRTPTGRPRSRTVGAGSSRIRPDGGIAKTTSSSHNNNNNNNNNNMSSPSSSRKAAITSCVNQKLIQAHILLKALGTTSTLPATGTNPDRATLEAALAHANAALAAAAEHRLAQLGAKAQLFRGHSLRALGRWREAYAAYVRAASVASFSRDVGPLTAECLAEIEREEDRERAERQRRQEEEEEEEEERKRRRRRRRQQMKKLEEAENEDEAASIDTAAAEAVWYGYDDEVEQGLLRAGEQQSIHDHDHDGFLLRDVEGSIVDEVKQRPRLRSLSGKSVPNLRVF